VSKTARMSQDAQHLCMVSMEQAISGKVLASFIQTNSQVVQMATVNGGASLHYHQAHKKSSIFH